MRHKKAYIVSLGLTGVMLALALVLLGLGGRVLGFSDWPGAVGDRLEDVLIQDEADEPERRRGGPSVVAADAAPAALAVARGPARSRRDRPASRARTQTGGARPGRSPSVIGPGPDRAPVRSRPRRRARTRAGGEPADPVSPESTTQAPSTVSRPVRGTSVKEGLAGATETLTAGVGETVRPLNDPLGQTVTDTGKALSQIVRTLPLP